MESDTFEFGHAWRMLQAGYPVTRQAWADEPDQNAWDLVALIPYAPTRHGLIVAPGATVVIMMQRRDGKMSGPLESFSLDDVAAADWRSVGAMVA